MKIIVFTSGIPRKDQKKLEQICGQFNTPLKLIKLDDNNFEGLSLHSHFNKITYYRLFAADLIQDDKCLYLDSDVIVNGSLAELINLDVNNYYLAAVENHDCYQVFNPNKEKLGMKLDSKYFNSGVMLINLNKWRNTNLKDLVITLIRKKPEAIRLVDQCGLNGIVDGDWIELDEKCNCQTCILTMAKYADVSCINVIKPIVIHFTGTNKPWHTNYNHPHKRLYWSYRNKTPYKAFFMDLLKPTNISRYFLPSLFKK